VSDQKDTTRGTRANTKFAKQSFLGKPLKVGETHALSKPVTSNLIPTPQESKAVKNDKVIAPGMFKINPFKPSREEKHVPNNVRASVRPNPITVSQPPVITKKAVNSDSNGLSSTGVDNTKTRRPQLRSNTKNDKVPSASKSSRIVCAMCKQCLISVNHDVCLLNYVNGMTSRGKKQKANVSIQENKKKQKSKVKKTKKAGSIKRLASPKPSKPRSFLRWSPTGRMFDLKGKIIVSSESESQSDCSKGDNACTSNPLEPTIKRFPNSTFSLEGFSDLKWGNILITRVYFVEGLDHNLFSVGQFCDSDLEVLVIVDDYSRYTWVHFLISKDEAPEVIKTFLKRITVLFQSPVIIIRTDNGTKFKNQVLKEYFDSVGTSHQMSSVRTPQQNRVVERRNRTLVEAARTMLIFSHALLSYGLKRLLLRVSLKTAPSFTVVLTKHHTSSLTAENRISPFFMYSGLSVIPGMIVKILGSLVKKTYASSTITTQQPTEGELDLLFEAMYDDYIGGQLSVAPRTIPAAQAPQQQGNQAPLQLETIAVNGSNAMFDANTFVNPFATPSTGEPSRPVLTRNQLRSDGDMCMYALTVSTMEPKNVKEAMTDPTWIESMQEELL
nr:ribonuclease H-like domain-containing protein [Tanacetum cinerariifolium]